MVVQLLQKAATMAAQGSPLRILSAVALDHLSVRAGLGELEGVAALVLHTSPASCALLWAGLS